MGVAAIHVHRLEKTYGAKPVVHGVDLEVAEGEIFALLGPNGAGKTTIVEILEGYRQRTAGTVEVLGHDPGKNERSYKERIGIVLQRTGIEPYLTVEETVELFRRYYPHPKPLDQVLSTVGLLEQRKTAVRKLSGGQQRRLDVAIGLSGDPDLLFLDEPTTGLDPTARRAAWDMLQGLRTLGKTVFLTTHYLDEAEYLAGRVAIIVEGRIAAEGSPRDLGGLKQVSTVRFRLSPGQALPELAGNAPTTDDGQVTMQTSTPTKLLYELTRWAHDQDFELQDLTVSRPSLEEIYLGLVATEGVAK
jgi:ABC-2 type transport system ATP-binding protein